MEQIFDRGFFNPVNLGRALRNNALNVAFYTLVFSSFPSLLKLHSRVDEIRDMASALAERDKNGPFDYIIGNKEYYDVYYIKCKV